MTPRRQRMLVVGIVVLGAAAAVGFALRAFDENLLYFYGPTEILADRPPEGRKIRLGGLVAPGSLRREPGQLEVRFDVTDLDNSMTVSYAGVLPDLFREGQGVIAHGIVLADGTFRATEVLAKHDENYMPPEVAESLQAKGHPANAGVTTAANP